MADILVVEDDPALGLLWERGLEQSGHAVRRAASVAEARREVMLAPAEVVILDLNLGRDSGLGLVTLAAYANPEVRVLVVTGTTLFPRGELFDLSPNIVSVLRKPVPLTQMTALIDHHDGPAAGRVADAATVPA